MDMKNDTGLLRRLGCVLMAVITAGAITACSQPEQPLPTETTIPSQTQQTTEPAQEVALAVESVTEQGDQILVTTSWCALRYPFAFGDLIRVTAAEVRGVPALCFTADIGGEEQPIFDLCFDSGEIPLGELELPGAGETAQVFAVLYSPAESLTEEQKSTFRAAQETFNDVTASLSENPGFTPAG